MMLADDGCTEFKSGSDVPSGYNLFGNRLCPQGKGPSTSIHSETVEINGKLVSPDQVKVNIPKFDSMGNKLTDKKDCFPFCGPSDS